jgi:uncharacterized spore protein YtfJ
VILSETYVKTLVDELSKIFSAESVIGDPIAHEDKVLIPVTKIGFGLGSATGKGKGGEGSGEGGGGGGGIEPVAVIAVFKGIPGPEGVKVLQLKAPSRIPEGLPEVIETAVGAFANIKAKEEPEESEEEKTNE